MIELISIYDIMFWGAKNMQVTIKDIAKLAGVSHMTVSRALNDSDTVKEETKAYIKKIASELNYTKNLNGRNLALSRYFNIGVYITSMVEGTSPQFLNEVITCIYSAVKGKYSLIIGAIQDSGTVEKLHHQNFDGMLIISQCKDDDQFISSVKAKGIPIVIMNRLIKGETCVYSDDSVGAYKACKYILDKGHKRLAFVEGTPSNVGTSLRKKGIVKALDECKDQVDGADFYEGRFTYESGYDAARAMMSSAHRPTAVFCYNDDMAIGVQKFLQDHHIRDIAVMGFDGSLIGEYCTPSLTSVKRPIKIIAEKAIELLIEKIESGNSGVTEVVYDQILIQRESL